jgi:hypothetical protein
MPSARAMDPKSDGASGDDTVMVPAEKAGQIPAQAPVQELTPLAGTSFAK